MPYFLYFFSGYLHIISIGLKIGLIDDMGYVIDTIDKKMDKRKYLKKILPAPKRSGKADERRGVRGPLRVPRPPPRPHFHIK